MEFDMTKPIPETQPWSEKFWEGTKQGKLLIQVCKDCKSKIFLSEEILSGMLVRQPGLDRGKWQGEDLYLLYGIQHGGAQVYG